MAEKRGLQKATVLAENMPPISVLYDGSIGYYVRYRVVSKDRNRFSHWSPINVVKLDPFPYIGVVDYTLLDNSVIAVWGDEYNRPKYDVFVKWGNVASKLMITPNGLPTLGSTVRIQVDNIDNYEVGSLISVSVDHQQSLVNGNFTVSNVYTQTSKHYIEYQIASNDNTQSEISVTGEVATRYLYHGTSSIHTYSFLKLAGYTLVHVDIQVESVEKTYTDNLLIYDSPAIPLT